MISRTTSIGVIRCKQALAMASATPSRWMHPLEHARWQQLRSPLRRNQWLAGRWWLKRQILQRWNLGVAPQELMIISHDARDLGVAPQAYIAGDRLPIALSLSHCDEYVAVALGSGEPGSCGIDVVHSRAADFTRLRTWIADEEVLAGRTDDAAQFQAAWAAKEAAFKTLSGEPFRPRQITLRPGAGSPWQWSYRLANNVITGEVELRRHSRFVLAIAHRHVPC